MYERFKRTTSTGVDVWYAFVECPVAMLDEQIPQSVLDGIYGVTEDDEGNKTSNVTDLPLRDFSLKVDLSLDGTKAIVNLGARYFDIGRWKAVNADDLADWDQYLTPYGFDSSKWIEREEYLEKRNSAEYNGESQL